MMDWHSIYIVDKKIFLFENVAFSLFLTLEIADLEKLRPIWIGEGQKTEVFQRPKNTYFSDG